MEESKLNRTRTHRNALPERGSTRQAVGGPRKERALLPICAVHAECWRETALLSRGGNQRHPPSLEEGLRPQPIGW